eukprot:scaffold593_cov126-Cylindrotheca_fusiformis.AAC.8
MMGNRGIPLDSNGFLPLPIQTSKNERLLPPQFKPGNWDVICHKGKFNKDHIGNMRFKICIVNHLRSYTKASTRSGRSAVITDIVASIRDSSDRGGGFVRFSPSLSQWYEVGDKVARDKVGQALRDILRNWKAIKDATPRIPVNSVPRKKKQEHNDASEIVKNKSNQPCTQVTQVPHGCDTGALSAKVTVAEHNCSFAPLRKAYSTVTFDSCSDFHRTWNNSSESRDDHLFTSTSTVACTHVNPYKGYFTENVAEWFEREMASAI